MTDTHSRPTPREVAAATPGVVSAIDAPDPTQPLITRVAEAMVSNLRSDNFNEKQLPNISLRLTVDGEHPAHLTATRVAEALLADADADATVQVQIARIV
ncbi:hypothetical protein [uncultured Microbacterium sp.]|uniref:hypothetical protein n=1 Tax=uncultured Microbacterium sp. TaxID=191216 RepID=UPI00261C16CB|nr:hypothetical protein [uncultured Microbacterium sp.]